MVEILLRECSTNETEHFLKRNGLKNDNKYWASHINTTQPCALKIYKFTN